MTTKKIIDGLYFTIGMILFNPMTGEGKIPEELNVDDRTTYDACMGAIEALRFYNPFVMTLEEIRDIYDYREDHVWPFDTPPYLWVETNGRTVPYWMSWNNVIACLEGQFPKYDPDDYGKSWRLWTSRPNEKERDETPWLK